MLMKSLITAFQFLTLLPLTKEPGQIETSGFARSTRYFPVVGIFLAVVLSVCSALLSSRFSGLTVAVMLVILLALLTRGLHLDGLSDTFDALFSGKSKDQMLALMKDHWSGALGTAALLSVLLLKIFLLAEIPDPSKIPALFLALAGARSGMSFVIGNFPYARGTEGLGYLFRKDITSTDWMIAIMISVIVALAAFPWIGILSLALGLISVGFFARFVNKKLGGLTGDVYGASNEIGEVAILFWLKIFLG